MIKQFDRFKYAEEFAHRLDNSGNKSWVIKPGPDVAYEEDGEEYTYPTYVVHWEEE